MKMRAYFSNRIEILMGVIASALIVFIIPLYAVNEPQRLEAAQVAQLEVDLDEAMNLYAENCSVCHGLAGEGMGAIPPLNTAVLQSMDTPSLEKIIARGLYGTSMPAWHIEDGGPLSDYQVSQLVKLIQHGDWQATQERVVNLGLAPHAPFTAQPDAAILEQVKALPDGEQIVAGITLFAEECVACHGADGLGSSLAPALNDAAVRLKTQEELERSIRLGIPGTLMAGWEKSLDDAQINAALALITSWDRVPAGAIPAPDQPILVTEESLALGADLYASSCSGCHGPEGQGSQRAPALNVRSFLTDTADMAIQQIITLGVTGTAMPAWGDRLTDAEIQAVVGFIRSWEPNAPAVAEPARIRGPWWRGNTTGATANQPGNSQTGGGQSSISPQATPWYQVLDWRSASLTLVVATVAILLILVAILGLVRPKRGVAPG
jgi:mono/diheme cytochrome c family protein